MKRFLSIIFLVGSAEMPNVAADGDQPAIRKRVFRSITDHRSSDSDHTIPLSIDPIALNRRIETPLVPEATLIVEPPIPEPETGGFIEDGPIPPLVKVVQSPGEQLASIRKADSAKAIGIAQSYYRRALWESSAEWYLRALDWDPKSIIAAEGFVMSAFHAGQYNYAYRVGQEMSTSIPGVQDKVIQAANEEISLLLKNRQLDQATELIDHFPKEESGLDESREKLRTLKNRLAMPGLLGSTNETSENQDSSKLFRTQTDKEPAKGLVISLRKTGDHEHLGQLVEQWGGILAEESKAAETTALDPTDINMVSLE